MRGERGHGTEDNLDDDDDDYDGLEWESEQRFHFSVCFRLERIQASKNGKIGKSLSFSLETILLYSIDVNPVRVELH